MKGKTYRISVSFLNLVGFLAVVIVNYVATTLPLNNKGTGELSDQYPNLFVPSGLTFSIWGAIYILLAIFVAYQLVTAFKARPGEGSFIEKVGIIFFISCIFNFGWIFAWHYEIVWLSLILMLGLLGSLLAIYLRLGIGKSDENNKVKGMIHIPFSVYMGWITIATIANVTALLVKLGWNRFGLNEQFWAVLVISVGIIIGLAILFSRNDIFYNLVVLWAFLGILLKRLGDKATPALSVIIVTAVGMAAIIIGIIIQAIRRKKLY
jgi:hypothetical protein